MSVQKWPTRKSFRIALKTVITTLLLPIFPVATVPVVILRQWSKFSIKKFHKDSHHIGKILDPMAQVLVHDQWTPNPRLNIVVCWFGEGSLSIESLREIFTNNVLDSKVDDGKGSSKLEYPELTSHIIKYGGYFYYKQIPDFDIKNYVRPYDHELKGKRIRGESDLKQIVAQMTSKGWPEDGSPWEVLLINNYVELDTTTDTDVANTPNFKPKTAIIFRIHHSLADGYSIRRIFKLLSTGKCKNSSDFTRNSNLITTLKRIFLAPYNMALLVDDFTNQPPTSWSMSLDKQGKAGSCLHQEWSGAIPQEVLKLIKNKYGVSFQAVLTCVMGGAIQKLMAGMKDEVPQVMAATLPTPLAGHPGGCVNHYGFFLIHIPVGEADPVKRLKLSEVEMQKLSKSPLPSMAYLLYNFVGMFPSAVTQFGTKIDIGHSVAFSPFPMLEGVGYIGNWSATDTVFSIGSGWGASGTMIITCSSYGKIRFGITMDHQVYSSEEVLTRFDEFIQADIQALLKDIQ